MITDDDDNVQHTYFYLQIYIMELYANFSRNTSLSTNFLYALVLANHRWN